ncbi:Ran-binding protein M homolog [Linum perenne]
MTNSASKTTATSTNYSSNNGNATCSNSGNPSSHQEDPASYFLALASGGGFVEEDREEAPTELNTINSSGGFVVVSTDKLSVKYKNVNLHGNDVGAVQANRPAPVKRLMYYFEMTVRNGGAKGQIAIGFTHEKFKMRRQPGWEANSCGYHGDDGHLYHGQGKGLPFGPTFTTKDIVGAGINYGSQEFFFTKNGALVGTVKKEINEALFPTVAVHSQNEEYVVPFPIFLFNGYPIKAHMFIAPYLAGLKLTLAKSNLNLISRQDYHSLLSSLFFFMDTYNFIALSVLTSKETSCEKFKSLYMVESLLIKL